MQLPLLRATIPLLSRYRSCTNTLTVMVTFVVVTGLFKRPQLVPMLSADVIFPFFLS